MDKCLSFVIEGGDKYQGYVWYHDADVQMIPTFDSPYYWYLVNIFSYSSCDFPGS